MNRLAQERSAYLNHAAHQKIDWYPWSDEPFERARKEGKPVFLSSGAVWCHWCHVMAKESFENDVSAQLMNELFINIKLDRDERPDIDRRYQLAAAVLGIRGGWPLSVFLTPDRELFHGGTYFPPVEHMGMPSFASVLREVSALYRTRGTDVAIHAAKIKAALAPEPLERSSLERSQLDAAETVMLEQCDFANGGFGSAPKFPLPGALEFLLRRAAASEAAARAARRALDAMASGGFRDHLGGGFHRYSVDEAWIVPHFEKMTDDNAGLLRNYIDGYAVFRDERYRIVAEEIVRFVREVLSDPAGGFFASQDADVTPDDEGGYFTWTDEEMRQALLPDEYALLSRYYLHVRGSMHHDPARHVLYEAESSGALAQSLGMSLESVKKIIETGNRKLLAARGLREAPFIDRALHADLNGMMISAFFHAYQVLGSDEVRAFAVASLDRVLRDLIAARRVLHVGNVSGVLEDYVHLVDALVAAYEATGDSSYLKRAEEIMDLCIEKFLDRKEGGFFDTEEAVLGTRIKHIQDTPHSAANSAAASVLVKLGLITGKAEYFTIAERLLGIFAVTGSETGVHAGTYFCALQSWFEKTKLTIETPAASSLARAARFHAAATHSVIAYGDDRGRVIPCAGMTCFEPVTDAASMPSAFLGRRG
jgi:uncharacterized protein YyaL (SSP411 family)